MLKLTALIRSAVTVNPAPANATWNVRNVWMKIYYIFPVNTENVYRSCANLFHHASPTAEAKSRAPFAIRRFHNIHTILTITWYKSRHLLNGKFRNETWNLGDFQVLWPVPILNLCGALLFRFYLAQKFATEETKEKTARYYFRFQTKYITIHFNCVLF
jgi:hypothetical protein